MGRDQFAPIEKPYMAQYLKRLETGEKSEKTKMEEKRSRRAKKKIELDELGDKLISAQIAEKNVQQTKTWWGKKNKEGTP